jgi:hypothetical protein
MRASLILLGLSLSTAVAADPHPYPTIDTVTMVINCMDDIGGQSENTLYTCSCRHDVIATKLDYDTWEKASLYVRYKHMPGENGGVFRDMKEGRELEAVLNQAQQEAEKACPVVKHIDAPNIQRQRRAIQKKLMEEKMAR